MMEKKIRLGYFPQPYPNELWIHVEWRFAKRSRIRNYPQLMHTLYDRIGRIRMLAIPTDLDVLESKLPMSMGLTSELILMNNTLLPYFFRFMPSEIGERNYLPDYDHKKNRKIIGVLSEVDYLRLCLLCVEEQRQEFGEAFFDRRCQLPGTRICTIHNAPLINTSIPTHKREQTPITLEDILHKNLLGNTLDISQNEFFWGTVARNSVWLLENSKHWLDPSELKLKYLNLLVSKGYSFGSVNRVSLQKLVSGMNDYYNADFLQDIGIDNSSIQWSRRILERSLGDKGRYQWPIRHILLINFLGQSLDEFFNTDSQITFFGTGPWQCLNPVCKYYKQSVIQDFNVEFRPAHIMGIFTCSCGCIHKQAKALNDDNKVYKYKVVDFGPYWRKSLAEDWNNQCLTNQDLMVKYKFSYQNLCKYAKKLNLTLPRIYLKRKTNLEQNTL